MINYTKLFDDFNIPSEIQTRKWIQVNCPFCNDTRFNGGFNLSEGFYNCWRCGGKSGVFALSRLLNVNPVTVKNDIIPQYRSKQLSKSETEISHANELELPTDTFLESERKYLLNRHFNPEKLHRKFGIVGGGVTGDFAYRIILPLFYKGTLVSWTGRSILSKSRCDALKIPRYYNLSVEKSVMNPKDLFFNMDNATKDTVILVEGPMDCIRMEDDCICSFGTGVKPSQQKLLADTYRKIYIAFDDEPEAQSKAKHLGMNLAALGVDVEIVNFCKDFNVNDPGDLKPSQVKLIKSELF